MLKFLQPKNGISLLELMLVIIVITALILGATRYYTIARDNMRIAQAMSMIKDVAQASYEWVKGQPNFKNIGNITTLAQAELLPEKYNKSPNKINPWHGDINVVSNNEGNLKLTMANIPDNICGKDSVLAKKVNTYADVNNSANCDNNTLSAIFAAP